MKTPKQPQLNSDMQKELHKSQMKVMTNYRKRLTPKLEKELQAFAVSGKQIGSSDFFKLSPLVREIFVKMNTSQVDIMSKHTKNPFKKLQLWIGKLVVKQLVNVDPKKKKKAKAKAKAKKLKK